MHEPGRIKYPEAVAIVAERTGRSHDIAGLADTAGELIGAYQSGEVKFYWPDGVRMPPLDWGGWANAEPWDPARDLPGALVNEDDINNKWPDPNQKTPKRVNNELRNAVAKHAHLKSEKTWDKFCDDLRKAEGKTGAPGWGDRSIKRYYSEVEPPK